MRNTIGISCIRYSSCYGRSLRTIDGVWFGTPRPDNAYLPLSELHLAEYASTQPFSPLLDTHAIPPNSLPSSIYSHALHAVIYRLCENLAQGSISIGLVNKISAILNSRLMLILAFLGLGHVQHDLGLTS